MFLEPCQCGFHLPTNKNGVGLTLKHTGLSRQNTFQCPVCGRSVVLELESIGAVLVDDDGRRIFHWRENDDAAGSNLSISGAQDVSRSEVFYDGVPVFRSGRDLVVPDLPVRPDFFGLVDPDRLDRRKAEIDHDQNRVRYRVPIRGQRELVEVLLPMYGTSGHETTTPRTDALEGVQLTVWPRLQIDAWRRFVVSLSAPPDSMADRTPVFRVLPAREGKLDRAHSDDTRAGWFEVGKAKTGPWSERVRWADVVDGGRPRALSVAYERADQKAVGGIFLPLEATPTTTAGSSLPVGIDFGTANSTVAFGDGERGGAVRGPGDLHEYLLRGASQSRHTPAADWTLSFCNRAFGGVAGDIYPSELLFATSAQAGEARGDGAISQWRAGVDFAIPGDDVDWDNFGLERHLAGGLKWRKAVGYGSRTEEVRTSLVRQYLKALLIQALASHLDAQPEDERAVPSSIDLRFGYPGRWNEADRTGLRGRLEEATTGSPKLPNFVPLNNWLELGDVKVTSGVSEALAAARLRPPTRVDEAAPWALDVYVDMGGGTTDISAIWQSPFKGEAPIFEYVVSLRYAGNDLLAALEGDGKPENNCYADARFDMRRANREIRQSGDAATPDLFDPQREQTRNARVGAFFGQLTDYVARMALSTIANGQLRRRAGTATKKLLVRLTRLGNGWNLLRFHNHAVDEWIRASVRARMKELWKSLQTISTRDGLMGHTFELEASLPEFELQLVNIPGHAKHAVAKGLLSDRAVASHRYASASRLDVLLQKTPDAAARATTDDLWTQAENQHQEPPWGERTVLGVLTRRSERLATEVRSNYLPWWLPWESVGMSQEHVHGLTRGDARLEWDGDLLKECALLVDGRPASDMGALRELADAASEVLDSTTADGWFTKPPLDTLLETALNERLRTLHEGGRT